MDMQERDIANKKCVPCEGGTPPLSREDVQGLLFQLHREWSIRPPFEQDTTGEGREILRVFVFENFPQAISFVNKVAELAEQEGHHPDLTIRYNTVKVRLSTHAIGGLSQNDFIMASKIDLLFPLN